MPHIDKHPPGAFCWIELSTTDQNAAKSFYTSLFGWASQDFPMGPNDFDTMFQLEGRDTGAAYTMRPEQRSHGVPPHWMIYIAGESADDAASRVAQLGGKVLAPPCDVYDAGRMAVVQDPTGAVFALWQAKKNTGDGNLRRAWHPLLGGSDDAGPRARQGVLLQSIRLEDYQGRK